MEKRLREDAVEGSHLQVKVRDRKTNSAGTSISAVQPPCYGPTTCPFKIHPSVLLVPSVMVFGGGAFGRWLGHEDGVLTNGLVPWEVETRISAAVRAAAWARTPPGASYGGTKGVDQCLPPSLHPHQNRTVLLLVNPEGSQGARLWSLDLASPCAQESRQAQGGLSGAGGGEGPCARPPPIDGCALRTQVPSRNVAYPVRRARTHRGGPRQTPLPPSRPPTPATPEGLPVCLLCPALTSAGSPGLRGGPRGRAVPRARRAPRALCREQGAHCLQWPWQPS